MKTRVVINTATLKMMASIVRDIESEEMRRAVSEHFAAHLERTTARFDRHNWDQSTIPMTGRRAVIVDGTAAA